MAKLGIFSGSFNPIHIGHLALANWLCEYQGMEQVWFLVTPQNPHKQQADLLPDGLRLEMVRAAVDGYPRFKVSDIEFSLPKPSYTIHTLAALEKSLPGHQLYFIIGADNWQTIHGWKEAPALLQKYPILIYPRYGYKAVVPPHLPNVKTVDAPLIDVSSSFIRTAFKEGKDVRFFLPESVRKYFL